MKKLVLIVFFAVAGNQLFAQVQKNQSIFIYSFTRYIIWPETYSTGDFEILVLGDSPIHEELKALAQAKKVGERAIKVTKIKNVADIRKANILFVSAGMGSAIESIISKVSSQSILIVTEETGLAAKGSNINFIVKDGKLAFELNQASMTKQNLKASMELSRLAILI